MNRFSVLVGILAITSLACSIPINIVIGEQNSTPTAEIIIVTATPAEGTPTPTLVKEPTAQPEPQKTANTQPNQQSVPAPAKQTQEASAASSATTVTVSQNTNCRSGPSQQFNITGQLLKGDMAEVVGKNTPSNYWIIKKPGSSSTCWLWGYYATVSGDTSKLSEVNPPATPTSPPTSTPSVTPPTLVPVRPAAVSNLQGFGSCDNPGDTIGSHHHTVSGTITWQDNATNELGFYIRIHGFSIGTSFPIATLPPNTTSYNFTAGTLDNAFAMVVESFNAAGSSDRKEIPIPYNCHP